MDISKRHEALLEAQQKHEPTLTVREMGEVLGMQSPSHVFWILDNMVRAGLAAKIKNGKKHVYRILPAEYKHNEAKHE